MRRLLTISLLTLLLAGCITPPWTATTNAEYVATDFNVAMKLPAGWMVNSHKDILLATRDGYLLQYISLENIHIEDELTNTKKKFSRGMLPLEHAEIILDNMSGKEQYTGFKVLSKKPAKLAGHQAFRAEYRFKDEDGLEYKGVYYGFMQNDWFYGVRYVAPKRHYYKRDLEKFEKAVKSMRLLV
jgi:hypothetical protein